jgi:hypothetical protein
VTRSVRSGQLLGFSSPARPYFFDLVIRVTRTTGNPELHRCLCLSWYVNEHTRPTLGELYVENLGNRVVVP